jgi:hypothetical protein
MAPRFVPEQFFATAEVWVFEALKNGSACGAQSSDGFIGRPPASTARAMTVALARQARTVHCAG